MRSPTSLTCGVDIGGTKIAGAVVDADGEVLEETRIPSPAADPRALAGVVARLIRDLATRHPVAAVGVGAAGYVDAARSTVLFAPNIAWRNEPLGEELARLTGLPVVIENDANAAAWGEFRFGAGRGTRDQLMVTIGTGVGGGIVADGRLLRGGFGVAGEIGHLCVVPDGRVCGCGNRGCLEQYASGSALVRTVRDAAAAGVPAAGPVLSLAGGDVQGITGPLITEAARTGDPFAAEQLETLGRWIGHGIASLVAILDPAVVVVGGGVGEAGDLVLASARAAFSRELSGRGFRPEAEIRSALLGNRAGVIGAADLARG